MRLMIFRRNDGTQQLFQAIKTRIGPLKLVSYFETKCKISHETAVRMRDDIAQRHAPKHE